MLKHGGEDSASDGIYCATSSAKYFFPGQFIDVKHYSSGGKDLKKWLQEKKVTVKKKMKKRKEVLE